MAISKDLWLKAKTLYETNQYSLAQISDKTGIDKSSISKKAKIQQWSSVENLDYIESKAIISKKKSTLNQQQIDILDEVANDRLRREQLVYGAQEKAIQKASGMIDGVDAPQDIKHLVDAIDKASITLGVSQRHANSQVNIQNTNAQQNNTIEDIDNMSNKEISNAYLDIIKQ